MERIFYEEKQKLPAVYTWLVVAAGLAMMFPLFRILYQLTVLGSESSMSITKVSILLVMLFVILGFVVWLTASFSLEVRIGASGIHYRYFPRHLKDQFIEARAIAGYDVRDLTLKEIIQSRRDRRLGSDFAQVYSVNGRTVVEVRLSGGQKVVLGAGNKDSISWAMKKLLENLS
jgi:hypothetical protein